MQPPTEEKTNQNKNGDTYETHNSEFWNPIVKAVGWAILSMFIAWVFCKATIDKDHYWSSFLQLTPNVLIVVVMGYHAFIYWRQWEAMQDGLKRTDELIGQNKNIIEAAKRQALAGEKALELTEEIFYVSERAYVCIDGRPAVPDYTIDLLSDIRFELKLVNGGRTPAFNVRVRSFQCSVAGSVLDIPNAIETVSKQCRDGLKKAKTESIGRIILAGKGETIWHNPEQSLSTPEYMAWKADKRQVFIPVEVSYEDIQGDTLSLIYWYQFFHGNGFSLRKPLVLEVLKHKDKTNKREKAN